MRASKFGLQVVKELGEREGAEWIQATRAGICAFRKLKEQPLGKLSSKDKRVSAN